MYELGLQYGGRVKIFSMYGRQSIADGNPYFPQELFTAFNLNRAKFVLQSIREGRKSNVIVLSHINLLFVGYFIKLARPSAKVYLLAHGIEVWRPLSSRKKKMLHALDGIIPVSHFTKEKMQVLYELSAEKLSVINNCLDPFLERPITAAPGELLRTHYGIQKGDPVLLSVSRMVSTEKYKGYDKVLKVIPHLAITYPSLRYMLVGKYDEKEKQRLDKLINELGISDKVIFTGFLPDENMAAHFSLADIFIMPSEKEGFGIVFIEAMFYGLPVIAGNKDGSTDALRDGEIGLLVDPNDNGEIQDALKKMLDNPKAYCVCPQKLEGYFGYASYKKKLGVVLQTDITI